MLNDICLLCCHLANKLCQDTPVYSLPDVPISAQIIATVNQKLHWQYPKWKISAHRDIDTNIIYVMIKHINQFILLSLKSTVNCNYMYNNFYTLEIFQLQMTERLATIFYRKMNWYQLWDISTILWHAASSSFSVVSFIISYMQKDYTKWYGTKHIYMLHI